MTRVQNAPARILLVCLLAFGVFAQQPSALPDATFSGTLHSIARKEIAVRTAEDNDLVFAINRKTRFLRNGRDAKLADFHVGETISVRAEAGEFGNMVASLVVWRHVPKK